MTTTMSSVHRAALLGLFALAGCGSEQRPIAYDRDTCEYCRMTISDRRFGGEVVTARGRLHTFDSVECLAAFVSTLDSSKAPRAIFVADYDHPGSLVPATSARYLRVTGPSSPMGGGLLAFAADADTTELTRRSGGVVLGWNDVLTSARDEIRKPGGVDQSQATASGVGR